jgi:hypothetical protein
MNFQQNLDNYVKENKELSKGAKTVKPVEPAKNSQE